MTHNLNKNTINGIIIGFVAAIVVSIFSSISTINYTNGVYTDLKTMYEKDIIGQNYIQTTRVYLLYCDREFNHFMLAKDEKIKVSTQVNIIKFKKGFLENMRNAKPLYYSTEGKSLMIKVEKAQQEYFELLEGKVEKVKQGQIKVELTNFEDLTAKFNQLDELLRRLDNIKKRNDLHIYRNFINAHKMNIFISVILLIGSIIFRAVIVIRKHRKHIKGL
jgi:hypothetical protein